MKVILFGSTGSIGSALPSLLLSHTTNAHPTITSLVLVTRRPLPQPKYSYTLNNDRVDVVILPDFSKYDDEVVQKLADADAAIWCLGTYNGDVKVEVEYPRAFHDALTSSPSWRTRTKPLRFVYLGGAFTVTDQEARLWFMPEARQVRGLAQSTVLEWASASASASASGEQQAQQERGKWETYVIRPAGVITEKLKGWYGAGCVWWVVRGLMGDGMVVDGGEVGSVMVELAVSGIGSSDGRGTLIESTEVGRWGRELLERDRRR